MSDTDPAESLPDFGEPLEALRAVPIAENSEPLVDPRTLSQRVHFAEKHPKFGDMPRDVRVRQTVAQMVARAADSLPDGWVLTVLEGHRPLAQQRHEHEDVQHDIAGKHSDWDANRLHAAVDNVSAPPDDPCPPPHSTGGAIDVCPVHAETGEYMDMVSPFTWDEESAPTDIAGLTPQAQANRQMFIQIMSGTGLTNYAGEWWHWSYGDSGWALRVGAPVAFYDRLPDDLDVVEAETAQQVEADAVRESE